MKKYFIIILFFGSLMTCDTGSKPSQRKKINNLTTVYMMTRAWSGRYNYGIPLCGGDPIGTLLGLNNDEVGHYTVWEEGKTYIYNAGDKPNEIVSPDSRFLGSILFLLQNSKSVKTQITYTLLEDCSYGFDVFDGDINFKAKFYFANTYCEGVSTMKRLDNVCQRFGASSPLFKKDEYIICSLNTSFQSHWFSGTGGIYCKIQMQVKGV